MHRPFRTLCLGIIFTMCGPIMYSQAADQVKLIVLDPGHFHASLVQKDMYPWVDPTAHVYAPLSPDVVDYLNRVALFNTRKENPTAWSIELHTGSDFFERMLHEHPGNVVILTGRNRPKIDRIEASIGAGLNVLADKPWIISSRDLPRLERVLHKAQEKKVVGYDIMTERFEITSILQRELVNNESVFGKLVQGTEGEPAVNARSIHHLMKVVAGVPLRRPVWFFDVNEYGEGLADVGTHVVDLVQWTAFPHDIIDYKKDIHVLNARRWPTVLSKSDFERVTGESQFPASLAAHVKDGKLDYDCNNSVHYTVRGAHVALDIRWNWESADGDIYEASFRGTKAKIELRQGVAQKFIPELYVVSQSPEVFAALDYWSATRQEQYPGLAIEHHAGEAHIVIPQKFRVGHEDHFAQVTNRFFDYLKNPSTLPAWEQSNMLVKYFVSTRGVEIASGH
jgi:predicted dehydrogenase